ncbi:hypothetical protein FBU30_010546, partial [Linnemannia zychae]
VKNFLGDLLYSHIKKELPSLKKEVLDLIQVHEKEIADLGAPILSTGAAKIKFFDNIFELRAMLTNLLDGSYTASYISQHFSEFQKQTEMITTDIRDDDSEDDDGHPLSLELDGDYQYIRSSLYRHYQRYNVVMNKDKYLLPKEETSKLVLRCRGNELPGFIAFATFTRIYVDTLSRWKDITKEHIDNMHKFLYKCISRFISTSAEPLLKDMLLFELDKFYNGQVTKIKNEINNIFMDESVPFTMNKYYYNNILEARKELLEKNIQQFIGKLPSYLDMSDGETKQLMQRILASFSKSALISDANYNEESAIDDLQENLKSYCKVARKRIVDIILLQTIERHIIRSIHIYFDSLIGVDDSFFSQLIESPAKQARRKELDEKVEILRKSLHEL